MNQTQKRNILGTIAAFLLGVLLGGVGVSVMMLREVWQSDKYGFAIEKDDVKRYSIAGGIGSLVNLGLLVSGYWLLK